MSLPAGLSSACARDRHLVSLPAWRKRRWGAQLGNPKLEETQRERRASLVRRYCFQIPEGLDDLFKTMFWSMNLTVGHQEVSAGKLGFKE